MNACAELRKLVASAHLDAPVELPARDRTCRVAEAPERRDDGAAEEVHHGREEDQRADQRREHSVLRRPGVRLNRGVRRQRGERQPLGLRERRGREAAVPDTGHADAPGPAGAKTERAAETRAGDDPSAADGDELVAGIEARGQARQELRVDGDADGDPAEDGVAVDHGHGPRGSLGRHTPDSQSGSPHAAARDAPDELQQRCDVAAAHGALQPWVPGELGRLGRSAVEPRRIAGDDPSQGRLQPGVDPSRLAALGQRVVAVERDSKR